MKLTGYTVHSVADDTVPAEVTLPDGQKAMAGVATTVIELVRDGSTTLTLQIPTFQFKDALAVGDTVEITVKKESGS